MRLLNSKTLELEEFFDDRGLKYAILSHRWLNDEVSLQDMQNGTAIGKAGYAKLKLCCDQAVKDGLDYSWVDTCCIDKTSSAELTEAINSMYRWYQNSVVCYAFMSDVECSEVTDDSDFAASAWFTRGWTLQELIAPTEVIFYNSAWQWLGTKDSLKDAISEVTNINIEMLEGADPEQFSVARRMSWASARTTTRIEDVAYSLLGLFGVNMPMLYGEGERAFTRLQEEIMKHSDDQSLFAWKSTSDSFRGLLAKSPADFADCSNIVQARTKWNRNPYSVTNKGLSIQVPMIAWAMETYLVALDCELEDTPNSRVGIFLRLLPEDKQYARVMLDGTDRQTFESRLAAKTEYRDIYVRQKIWGSRPPVDRMYGFWIRQLPTKISTLPGLGKSEVTTWGPWDDEERILKIPTGSNGTAGSIWYKSNGKSYALKLGFDPEFNPVCQFGGQLSSPGSTSTPRSFEGQMHPSWMLPRSDYLSKGDRLVGIRNDIYPHRILVTDETIEGQRMWVVDILNIGTVRAANLASKHARNLGSEDAGIEHDAVCDGCQFVSSRVLTPPLFIPVG